MLPQVVTHSHSTTTQRSAVRRYCFSIVLELTVISGLSEFVCDPDEEVASVLALQQGRYFVVGTVRHQIGETEPSRGRLLLFSFEVGQTAPTGERGRSLELNLVTVNEAEGCPYALAEVNGAIVAAVNTSVSHAIDPWSCNAQQSHLQLDLYRIVTDPDPYDTATPPIRLVRLARWNHSYFLTNLAVDGDNVIVGDAIASVSILRVVENDFQTIARHYGPMWPIAVQGMQNGVLGANVRLLYLEERGHG